MTALQLENIPRLNDSDGKEMLCGIIKVLWTIFQIKLELSGCSLILLLHVFE